MELNDLFVSHKQVEPVSFYFEEPDIYRSPYINFSRASKVVLGDLDQNVDDMTTWAVGRGSDTNLETLDWKVRHLTSSDLNGHSNYQKYTGNVPRHALDIISFFENNERYFEDNLEQKDLVGYDLKEPAAKGHKTYGYGLLYHPRYVDKFMDEVKSTYTQKELEDLFVLRVSNEYNNVLNWAKRNNLNLTDAQVSALTSICYNTGSGFLNWSLARKIKNNPNDDTIFDAWSNWGNHLFAQYPGLKTRRRREANMYIGNEDWKNS